MASSFIISRLFSNVSLVFRKETTCQRLFYSSLSKGDHRLFHVSNSVQQLPPTALCRLGAASLHFVLKRSKYSRGRDGEKNTDEDDDESDSSNFSDLDPGVMADVDGKDIKIVKTKLNSLRLDTVLKAGLGTAKNKVDTAFYESRIRVNGEKALKKSKRMDPGDEIDLIKGINVINSAFLDVGRVIILAADFNSDLEKVSVVLKRYRSLTIENYSNHPYKAGAP